MPHSANMTLAGFPRISVDPQVCGGRPVVTGTRVRVYEKRYHLLLRGLFNDRQFFRAQKANFSGFSDWEQPYVLGSGPIKGYTEPR